MASPDTPLHVGLDIGGTKFLAAAVDGRGRAGPTIREPTPQSLAEGLNLLKEMVGQVCAGRTAARSTGGPAWSARCTSRSGEVFR